MRVAHVPTNWTCNQNCTFCTGRLAHDDPRWAGGRAVAARASQAIREGMIHIVLTGGEPTLRSDLPSLVSFCRRAGAEHVAIETNATLIDDAMASRLSNAGLDLARVHVVSWDPALADRLCRDPGGFAALRRGLDALAKAGIALEVATPVLDATAESLVSLPRALRAEAPFILAMQVEVPVRAPDPSVLASLARAARCIEQLESEARAARIPIRFDPGTLLPPCVFDRPARMALLYSLTPGGAQRPGYVSVSECGRCCLRDCCPGVPAAVRERGETLQLQPQGDEVRRRVAAVASTQEQAARELVTRASLVLQGRTVVESTVRVNFACNQACIFCFVSTHLASVAEEVIERTIVHAAREGGAVTLSGGEPALNPNLIRYVALARREGALRICLQSNATRLTARMLHELAQAGLDCVTTSLHATTAALSDELTGAPGTFEQTCAGIDEVARSGLELSINFVLCQANFAQFPDFVELVHARWPGATLIVSFVALATDLVPLDRKLIPRYADVLPSLQTGIERARALGLTLTGFESMCGLPLCQLPPELVRAPTSPQAPLDGDGGEFIRSEGCRRCGVRDRCWGIRRGYAQLYGNGELHPIDGNGEPLGN
jgi:molybdenum cofactor biosynthesis enzyme MoaA